MTQARRVISRLIATAVLAGSLGNAQAAMDPQTRSALQAAIQGEHRSADNRARDIYRKPLETLDFLGFRPDMTVVEIWPGSGWYTEILGPALRDHGRLYAAQFSLNPPSAYQRRAFGKFLGMLGAHPDLFRQVQITHLDIPYDLHIAPAGSADMVLTFRNVHNWVMPGNGGGKNAHLVFDAMFRALKPGGILGIVDHRWPDPATEDPLARNGYISAERTIALAREAGFELAARSEILANPRDTHDHPRGVWTLPPSLALGDKDRAHYLSIGESDRFLLKFVKPAP